MQFLNQPLTWGFLLVLLPLLIHLINMMRHRRVEWAAMEFLLSSYRKHRRWVWLKQLLLLLMRMAAIAAAVAMFAKLVTPDEWNRFLGRQTTHHYVVLDDSLSMSDRSGSGAAFDRARRAISQLVADARRGDQAQRLTLVRYSRATRTSTDATSPTDVTDINAQVIDDELELGWEQQGSRLRVSQLAVGAQPALALIEQLIATNDAEQSVLHLISDFRLTDWSNPDDTRRNLSRLEKQGTSINLIRCVKENAANLAVIDLQPEAHTQAAGVPLFMEVTIKNFSPQPAEQIRVHVRSTLHPTSPQGIESQPQVTDLPDLLIDRIEPGATVTRRFQVFFSTPGSHVVEVELPVDPIRADNRRWSVVALAGGESAIVIDGASDERSAYYLQSVFRPGPRIKTGIVPTVQPLNYLRDASIEELTRHHAIYLLDVPSLDARSAENLRNYIEQGGGVSCFLGANADPAFYTRWYEEGVFPIPTSGAKDFVSIDDSTSADIQFGKHAVFEILAGQRNPFAAAIRVKRHIVPPDGWKPTPDSGVEVIADLRSGTPFVVERRLGQGTMIAVLSSLVPEWNNWALEPSFVVVALQLHGHLAQSQRPRTNRVVGELVNLQIDGSEYLPDVTFNVPSAADDGTRVITKTAEQVSSESPLLHTQLAPHGSTDQMDIGDTDLSGVYEARLETLANQVHHRRFALNVDPSESELPHAERAALQQTLAPIDVKIFDADRPLQSAANPERNNWSEILLWVLIGLLLFEQWFAYRLSYHMRPLQPAGGTA